MFGTVISGAHFGDERKSEIQRWQAISGMEPGITWFDEARWHGFAPLNARPDFEGVEEASGHY